MTSNSPRRAALYGRYSTDRQRETSIADQLRAARARAQAEGWTIVAEHADTETSGSVPVALRSGGKALLADALAGRFDVLVLEGLDRLSREVGDQEAVVKRLEHRSIRIIGTADGYDSDARGRKVMRIARGMVSELYLDDLREKTHRGLAGQFDRGFHVGGVCYGYRSEPTPDGRGRRLVVEHSQAEIVRRMFQSYAEGTSARMIVHQLNADGVPAPRGGTWALSALVGDRKRGAGLLNNELYIGRLVWNRRQWLKDPETGKRRYVDRPRDEWQIRDVPDLAIVDPQTWAAVRARDRTVAGRVGAPLRTLFAGLLRCPACGGPMTAIDARRYGCNVRNDRGPAACSNAQAFPRLRVDDALIGVVRQDLMSPAGLAELHRAARAAIAAVPTASRRQIAAAARTQALQGEIGRLVDAVAQVGVSTALAARLAAAERELAELQTEQRRIEDELAPSITADQVVAAYRRRMLALRDALEQDIDRERTRMLLAELLGPVVLTRDEDGAWAEMQEPAQRVALAGSAGGSTPPKLVAGACNVNRRRIRIA